MVTDNIELVRKAISEVCLRCGRQPGEITLLGVSKTVGIEAIREAAQAGLIDLGENYVQDLVSKRDELADEKIHWHFIGHLQSNKAKYIADFITLVHSVDSLRLGEELSKRAERIHRILSVLIEVHTTGETTKSGVKPDQVVELAKGLSQLPGIHVKGLMTMGPFSDDPEDSRPSFQQLAVLRKKIAAEGIENCSMDHLSMGMTHDFSVAIEEGATIVRIGTAIFGER
ncbi:MAG: YggS family pyridoxal phosphate-dependent enzyme [bacterium]